MGESTPIRAVRAFVSRLAVRRGGGVSFVRSIPFATELPPATARDFRLLRSEIDEVSGQHCCWVSVERTANYADVFILLLEFF